MKFKLVSSFAEFVTIYDDEGNEIVEFESDNIRALEDSLEKLLKYLNIEYELDY